MRHYLHITVLLLACFGVSNPAVAAGYLKIGDIKGEATAKPLEVSGLKMEHDVIEQRDRAGTMKKSAKPSRPASKTKGKVEYQWKVEEGQK